MKSSLGIFAALVIGALVGWYLGRLQTRAAILSGPYSDNYGPALAAISEAKSKLQSGDTICLNTYLPQSSKSKKHNSGPRDFWARDVEIRTTVLVDEPSELHLELFRPARSLFLGTANHVS